MLENSMVVNPITEHDREPHGTCEECGADALEEDARYCFEHLDCLADLKEYAEKARVKNDKLMDRLQLVKNELFYTLQKLKEARGHTNGGANG